MSAGLQTFIVACGGAAVAGIFTLIKYALERRDKKADKQEDKNESNKSTIKEIQKALASIHQELLVHISSYQIDKANQARTRILRFGDEARRGLPHTQEHWEDVLRDIDAYEKYCDSHKEYINSKAVSTIAFLRARYAEHLEQNDFLQ